MINDSEPIVVDGRKGWFKSSYSNALGSCVEVNFDDGGILVRDSKDKCVDSPTMTTGGAGWLAFLDVVATHSLTESAPGA